MNIKKTGLGRGLGSLIPNVSKANLVSSSGEDLSHEKVYQIPVSQIKANPFQPRKEFSQDELEDLAASIKQYGVILPLVVTKLDENDYELIAGERRLRASKLAGLKTVPAILKTAKEMEKLEIALIENVQREELNDIEKAKAYHYLISQFGLSAREVGERVGQKEPTIINMVRLLSLPEEIKQALMDGKIRKGHAKWILSGQTPEKQMEIFNEVMKHDLNIPDTEIVAKRVTKKKRKQMFVYSDREFDDMRRQLEEYLGTKVHLKIQLKKKEVTGESGHIEIQFFSKEDLKGLMEKIINI